MNKTNMNPTPEEELEELFNAKIILEKVKSDKKEQQKVPLSINSTTTIFVHPSKQTEEYRQKFIDRIAAFREAYLRD